MSATFGPDLILPTKDSGSYCIDTSPQEMRDVPHKDFSSENAGKVIQKEPLGQLIFPASLIHHSLDRWRENTRIDGCMCTDTFLPLSDARIDMVAYTFFILHAWRIQSNL